MSESALDWKDATTHRTPKWPLLGYAPGGYIGRCIKCREVFYNLDKRAYHCFPCAIDGANNAMHEFERQISELKAENDALRAAIHIVDPAAIRQQEKP